jgi:hypothetical protein
LIFTCECDLTPIAEQPILVTQKKKNGGPLRSNSDSGSLRALLCQTFTLPVGYVSRNKKIIILSPLCPRCQGQGNNNIKRKKIIIIPKQHASPSRQSTTAKVSFLFCCVARVVDAAAPYMATYILTYVHTYMQTMYCYLHVYFIIFYMSFTPSFPVTK